MSNNSADIKDYVTLFTSTGVPDDAANPSHYTWNIPQSYYSNQRSSICSVSCVGANITTKNSYNSVIVVWDGGTTNSYEQNQRAVLFHPTAVGFPVATGNKAFHTSPDANKIELMVRPRPSTITLAFVGEAGVRDKYIATGCITLCFSYYNQEASTKLLMDQYTPTL
jgi:hypothetical protein